MRLLFKMAYTTLPIAHNVEGLSEDDIHVHKTATRFLAGKVYQPDSDQVDLSNIKSTSLNIPMSQLRCKDMQDMAILMLRSVVGYQRFSKPVQPANYVEQIAAEILNAENVVTGAERYWLFLALSIKKPMLLTHLIEVFGIAHSQGRQQARDDILDKVGECVRHLDVSSGPSMGGETAQLLSAIETGGASAYELLLRILQILHEQILANYDAKKEAGVVNLPFHLPDSFKDVVIKRWDYVACLEPSACPNLSTCGFSPVVS